MAKASKLDNLSDQVITALLEKHACPLPFHAVRALFTQTTAFGSTPITVLFERSVQAQRK
jgi:hypothetical protein